MLFWILFVGVGRPVRLVKRWGGSGLELSWMGGGIGDSIAIKRSFAVEEILPLNHC